MRILAGYKAKLKSDRNTYLNNVKIIENKKVSHYDFIILIFSIILLKNKICKFCNEIMGIRQHRCPFYILKIK